VAIYEGFSIEQVGVGPGVLKISANNKSTFRIHFKLDQKFEINMTDRVLHHELTLYFYRGSDYHLQLHLVIKVADNILHKMKARSEATQYQNGNTMGYILLNFVSFAYIILVILQLRREEE
jgi:hypothetical protein